MKKINLTEFIKKSSESLSMTQSERVRMERVLSEYMQMKPMRNAPLSRRAPVQHFFLSVYAFSRKSVALSLVLVLLLSGAGASYAAENALPGDVLYTLKVRVNEPVVAALSVSKEAKVEWNTKRAERRLEEAAKLAADNKLDETIEAQLIARFETHADAAVLEVDHLETAGSNEAIAIASRFETRLSAHDVVLEDAGHEKLDSMRDRVRAKVVALSKIRERIEGVATVSAAVAVASAPAPTMALMAVSDGSTITEEEAGDASATRMAKTGTTEADAELEQSQNIWTPSKSVVEHTADSAEDTLNDAEKLFSKIKGRLNADSAARITAELADARALFTAGVQSLKAGDLREAFDAFQKSLATSEKLEVYLKAFSKSRISTIPEIRLPVERVQGRLIHVETDVEVTGEVEDGKKTEEAEDEARVRIGL